MDDIIYQADFVVKNGKIVKCKHWGHPTEYSDAVIPLQVFYLLNIPKSVFIQDSRIVFNQFDGVLRNRLSPIKERTDAK